ncbi:siphovirus Gp157 family protein [Sporomusa acidovorans]|uniref:Siphovirus Gp157 n=1 Tax=Sporomusa acidovorans (strain ATCC 49682 / DSM 3132 / Mol) TaxID=1123286 RepID=A0ABZ3J9B8_SPOA4|nr:siphovirus Gp157 family protein [Sporomusa acidovorans]OZC16043.1 hypothetical protein SPACI_44090 [Sporomusa acidovorans DSM 3132]SDD88662.1 virus Gp157 [Sporomusa acidovorans]
MKLYELSTAHQQVFDLLLDEDSDLEVLEETLQCIEGDLEVKVKNGIGLIRSLEAYHDAIEVEEKRLSQKKKTTKNRIDWIKNLYKQTMEIMKKDKVQTPIGTMALQNNPGSLVIDNEKLIPAEFTIVIPEHFEPNKEKIKAALKAGMEVPGVRIMRGKSLRIR